MNIWVVLILALVAFYVIKECFEGLGLLLAIPLSVACFFIWVYFGVKGLWLAIPISVAIFTIGVYYEGVLGFLLSTSISVACFFAWKYFGVKGLLLAISIPAVICLAVGISQSARENREKEEAQREEEEKRRRKENEKKREEEEKRRAAEAARKREEEHRKSVADAVPKVNVKDVLAKAVKAKENGNVNFFGFYGDMPEAEAVALAAHYGLGKAEWSFKDGRTRGGYDVIWLSLKSVRRLTNGGNTADELFEAVKKEIGAFKPITAKDKDERTVFCYYKYSTIDNISVYFTPEPYFYTTKYSYNSGRAGFEIYGAIEHPNP